MKTMIGRIGLCLLAAIVLAGCGGSQKRYPMAGEIMALDPAAHNATIKHGKIGDWMDAMTMEYTVKPDAEFAKLHVGDRIQATVVVQDPVYWVTDVKVTGSGPGAGQP
jgi:Cu/Ag efflux protein CusF